MRSWTVAALGAAVGIVLITLGFNFRFGGYGSSWWLTAPAAYIPAAIAGAVIAVGVDMILGRDRRD
jgi:hypothetical protein